MTQLHLQKVFKYPHRFHKQMLPMWYWSYYKFQVLLVQSTPIISSQLGAKICEHELSGSPVMSRFHAKAKTSDFQEDHTGFPLLSDFL